MRDNKTAAWLIGLILGVGGTCLGAVDTDGDGIPDQQEEMLGTDPASPEVFQTILQRPATPAAQQKAGYDPSKDFTKVEFCSVGEDRCLWRVTLAAPPRLQDTVLHLYIDADGDAKTGRKAGKDSSINGTDFMVTVAQARGSSTAYDASGNVVAGPMVRHAVLDNTVLICADLPLARDDKGIRFGVSVLCHTVAGADKKPAMSASTPKQVVGGIAPSGRKKIFRPQDAADNFNVAGMFGYQQLCALLKEPQNIVIAHDKLMLEGFEVDPDTSNRFAHVTLRKQGGLVWAKAPRAGRYHVGFMMFDDSSADRVALYIENRCFGVAVARQDNNRTWLFWLTEAYDFRGGELIELRALGNGKHGICNVLLLPKPPAPRAIEYRVENMTSAADVGTPGRVTLSWTTTWPCPTKFEYGADDKYGQVVESSNACLVHRVVLEKLRPGQRYHGRAVGRSKSGEVFFGADYEFAADPPRPPLTAQAIRSVPLIAKNPFKYEVNDWPIATGIPFKQGELQSIEQVRVMGSQGEIPAQISLAARWPDGSVKWLLARFKASAPASGEGAYRLEYGRDIRSAAIPAGLSVARSEQGVSVDTGRLRLRIDEKGNLAQVQRGDQSLIRDGASCDTIARDFAGNTYRVHDKAQITVEEAGPLRTMIQVVSRLTGAKGEPLIRLETRYEAWRDSAGVRVHHTFVVEEGQPFIELKEMTYRVPLVNSRWKAPVIGAAPLVLDAARPLAQQVLDQTLTTGAPGKPQQSKGRAIGSLIAGDGSCAIAVRDFWQNYPKGFAVTGDAVDIQLCPSFEKGLYDSFPFEREGHHLYYYLLDGKYRLRRGMAKTHEVLLCFDTAEKLEQTCEVFQRPLLAVAPPQWYCGSRAFYDVAPRDVGRFKLYEEAIDKNLAAYQAGRERWHDYGMMNYGDWYPERGANWGNIEYDTQHAFFLEYIRSGNPDAFFLGDAAETHNRDIDTIHFDPDPRRIGHVYIHQMGHVGGFYEQSVPGTLGFPASGTSVSHAWAEGHFDHYFLTGDRRSYETGCEVADFFIRQELGRPYDFLSCRVPGWHLIMLAAAHAATGDPYYLNAAKVVVDRVLETQDREPRPLPDYQAQGRKPYQLGTWSRMLVPGHCECIPRHRGNAGFMVAVLLSGLKYYHDVTGDPRVKECIILGAHGLLDETYSDEVRGFRYTSCPKTRYVRGASMLMVEGVARAYLWTKDERFKRVLTEGLPLGASGATYGKGFSFYYRMAPRVLADLSAAGLTFDAPPPPPPEQSAPAK